MRLLCCFTALWITLFVPQVLAQDMAYKQPPKEIADLITAKPMPSFSFSDDGVWMMMMEREALIPVEELATPELGLGGLRINPATFAPSRDRYAVGIRFKNLITLKEYEVAGMPANPKITNLRWSPQDKYVAFTNITPSGLELWRISLADCKAVKLSNRRLSNVLCAPFLFVTDEELIMQVVPDGTGDIPAKPRIPKGVVAQDSKGKAAPAMTFQNLLKDAYDEELFDYFGRSQLVLWTANGEQELGKPDMYAALDPSPDKKYLLVVTVHRPYSYQVTFDRFPQKTEVWNMEGKLVKLLADNPLEENIPIGYDVCSAYPRRFEWRADEAATVVWAEALDGGDGKTAVPHRDAIYSLAAPFNGEKQLFLKTELRYWGISWGNDQLALYTNGSSAIQRTRIYSVNPSDLSKPPVLLFDRSANDQYSDPGKPYTVQNKYGRYVLYTSKNNELLFTGDGSSPEGDMPFLNSFNLSTKATTTLWRCKAPYYERVVRIINPEGREFITSKQSITEPENIYRYNLQKKQTAQLSSFAHPYPQMVGVEKQQIRYKRKDGVELTAVVYTPKGYDSKRDGRLPVLMWAYPREYKSATDAAQVRGSKYTFTRLSYGSPVLWVTQGFAIMDEAEMPIVGEGGVEPNDHFIEQLVMNAEAAIGKIEEMGIGDRNRVAVGGHSYGAFMTANLLAHSNLFKAGIARSGAYNRTLTPFGFQGERRSYWQASEVYNEMSPFMYADKLKTPILLIHGAADDNPGTFTIQSERFFAALKGNGATARLVLLPYESHGYTAKENIMHMLYETDTWLKQYVK